MPLNNDPAISQSVAGGDMLTSAQTIYQTSAGEIFWRNFLAGFGRALGGIVVYLLFLVGMYVFVSRFIWPSVEPFFTSFTRSMELLESSQSQAQQLLPLLNNPMDAGTRTGTQPGTPTYSLEDLNQWYQSLQNSPPAPQNPPSQPVQ